MLSKENMQSYTQQYFTYSLQLSQRELEIKQRMAARLPKRIIDLHSHLGRLEDALDLDQALYTNIISTYPYCTYEEHLTARKNLWPQDIEITQIAFGFPFRGIDIRQSNLYIQTIASQDPLFIPFLTGEPYDIAYTQKELETGRWHGLKMYLYQLNTSAERITDFFPLPILETANALQLPIILHLPHNIIEDCSELTQLAERYPDLPFVIAHFGMARGTPQAIKEALTATKSYPNIYYDTSFFQDQEVFCSGLGILGPEKIFYASDQPFNLLRVEFTNHPSFGERLMVDYPYHWADPEEQQYYREMTGLLPEQFLNFHYGSMQALLQAIDTVYSSQALRDSAIDNIFFRNARQLLRLPSEASRFATL